MDCLLYSVDGIRESSLMTALRKARLKIFFCNQQNPTLWVVIRDVSNMRALSHSG